MWPNRYRFVTEKASGNANSQRTNRQARHQVPSAGEGIERLREEETRLAEESLEFLDGQPGLPDYVPEGADSHVLAVPGHRHADVAFDVDSMAALLAYEGESGAFERPCGFSGFDRGELGHPGSRLLPGPAR